MSIVLSKPTLQRLLKDVREVMYQQPLHDQGIYYLHDDADILRGYAMIVGPADTPYAGGYFFFQFQFPHDYPFAPPKVTYCTNADRVRFNPNLYCNGKVCVSLLNTWKGEQWSACQSISSVLLAICSLLNEEPLSNEPGYNPAEATAKEYHRMLEAATASIAICDIAERRPGVHQPFFDLFREVVEQRFRANSDRLLRSWEQRSLQPDEEIFNELYNFRFVVRPAHILARLQGVQRLFLSPATQKKIEPLPEQDSVEGQTENTV